MMGDPESGRPTRCIPIVVRFLHFLLLNPLTPSNSTIAKNDATGNLHPSEAQTPRGCNEGTRTISR